MATNPYYVVTGAPVTQSRGVSATIRSEYSAIHTGFDAVYVAMLLRGLKGGETWTGTHVFTGATVTFATQSALDSSTKAATTAYADAAVAALAATKADIASPTFTGTPSAPTAAAGTSTTQIATTEFVATTAFSSVLPGQTSNAGKFVTTDGTNASWEFPLPTQTSNSGKFLTTNGTAASWASPTVPRVEVTTDTVLDGTHSGKLIIMTSATERAITLPLSTAVPDGWFCYLQNKSTGSEPHYVYKNAGDTYAECSDGATTWSNYAFYPEEVRMVMKATAGFKSIVLRSFYVTILSTVSFSRPPGYSAFAGYLHGGGGSGGRSGNASYIGAGGGGGACNPFYITKDRFGGAQTITIGAGGAARSGTQAGEGGGYSLIGSMVGAYGGGGGGIGSASSASASGGGGGGAWSAGATGTDGSTSYSAFGGQPASNVSTSVTHYNSGLGGAGGESYSGVTHGTNAAYGGGGGGSFGGAGGGSVYGGGGGGSTSSGGSCQMFGGAGGAGSSASNGTNGTVPAGGGGGTRTGTTSGAGANGQCIIWGVI